MAQHNSKTPTEERDSWRTPPWLFRWLDERFAFDIDLAADKSNALCPSYYTAELSAIGEDWRQFGSTGFCNPPYSNIDPWIEDAIGIMRSGFTTVMVFPSPNGEERFADVFSNASEVIDIVGRVAFLKPDGTPVSGNTRGTSVYIFEPGFEAAPCRRWWVLRDELIKRYGQRAA